MTRPNILFIMADQLGAGSLGCYGGVDCSPTLDKLARRGIRFDRCYATCPVCAPNRATILTGRSPLVHGVTGNNLKLQPDNPTYAHVLRKAGYRLGGFGKFHVDSMALPVPQDLSHLGFDEVIVTEDPRLGPWLDWIRREHGEYYHQALATCWPIPWMRHYGPDGEDLTEAYIATYHKHLAPRAKASPWYLMYPSPLPPELNQTAYITDRAIDFISRHVQDQPDRPFFCYVSYVDPHDPYDPPEPYASMFETADMPPARPAAWMAQGCPTLERSRRFHDFHKHDRPDVIATLRALFAGSVRYIDDQIARLVGFLADRGLTENTIVVFTTDHGEMLGDHGLITKGVKHYDMGVRNPLIVAGTGAQGRLDDRLVCGLDFFPTFCDWAGIPPEQRPPLEGRSFAGTDATPQAEPWGELAVECTSVRSLITDDGYRLTVYTDDGYCQMFTLRDDPDEQHNLYSDPAWAPKRRELFERMARAYARPSRLPQFRNYPSVNGSRVLTSGDPCDVRTDVFQMPEV